MFAHKNSAPSSLLLDDCTYAGDEAGALGDAWGICREAWLE
ncbi:MAG: hypothetical protein ACU88J_05860 [Gammaproteobacteria bacterium]